MFDRRRETDRQRKRQKETETDRQRAEQHHNGTVSHIEIQMDLRVNISKSVNVFLINAVKTDLFFLPPIHRLKTLRMIFFQT